MESKHRHKQAIKSLTQRLKHLNIRLGRDKVILISVAFAVALGLFAFAQTQGVDLFHSIEVAIIIIIVGLITAFGKPSDTII